MSPLHPLHLPGESSLSGGAVEGDQAGAEKKGGGCGKGGWACGIRPEQLPLSSLLLCYHGLFWDSSSLTSERRQFLGRGNVLQSRVSSQCPTTPSFHCLIPEAGSWTLRKVGPSLTTLLVRTPPRRLERSNQDPTTLSFLGS